MQGAATKAMFPIGQELIRRVAAAPRGVNSLRLEHRDEALSHALAFGPASTARKGDRFVGMCVREATLDCGERGCPGVELFCSVPARPA